MTAIPLASPWSCRKPAGVIMSTGPVSTRTRWRLAAIIGVPNPRRCQVASRNKRLQKRPLSDSYAAVASIANVNSWLRQIGLGKADATRVGEAYREDAARLATLRTWLAQRGGTPTHPRFPTRRCRALSCNALEHRLVNYVAIGTRACPPTPCSPSWRDCDYADSSSALRVGNGTHVGILRRSAFMRVRPTSARESWW
jgi:hypothetical protein